MSFASEGDKMKVVQGGVEGAFWQLYLLPAIQSRAKNVLNDLAQAKSESDDIKRGIYQGLLWVISLPANDILAYRRLESEAAEAHNSEAEEALRVELGRNAPFRIVDVGELKDNAADNPAAQEN